MLLLQEEWYKILDIGVMGQAPIKPNQTLCHLYSTCMGKVPWNSKAEEYTMEPVGSEGEDEGEDGCCVRRLLWRLVVSRQVAFCPTGLRNPPVQLSIDSYTLILKHN